MRKFMAMRKAIIHSLIALGLISVGATATMLATTKPAAAQRSCIRQNFPGDRMQLINVCNNYLYVEWEDDRGTHVTAIGPGQIRDVGRIASSVSIGRVVPQ